MLVLVVLDAGDGIGCWAWLATCLESVNIILSIWWSVVGDQHQRHRQIDRQISRQTETVLDRETEREATQKTNERQTKKERVHGKDSERGMFMLLVDILDLVSTFSSSTLFVSLLPVLPSPSPYSLPAHYSSSSCFYSVLSPSLSLILLLFQNSSSASSSCSYSFPCILHLSTVRDYSLASLLPVRFFSVELYVALYPSWYTGEEFSLLISLSSRNSISSFSLRIA